MDDEFKINFATYFVHKLLCLSFLVMFELVTACPSHGQALSKPDESNENAKSDEKQVSTEDYLLWDTMLSSKISANGRWVSYLIKYSSEIDTLFLRNTKTYKAHKIAKGHIDGTFTNDERFFVCRVSGTEKGILYVNLKTGKRVLIKGASRYTLSENGMFLAIHTGKDEQLNKSKKNRLLLINLQRGITKDIVNVSEFGFKGNDSLVYLVNTEVTHFVASLNLKKESEPSKIIIQNDNSSFRRLIWDKNHKSFAFLQPFKDDRYKEESHIIHHYYNKKLYSFDHRRSKEFPEHMYASASRRSKFFIHEDSPNVFFGIASWALAIDSNDEFENNTIQSNVQVWTSKDKEIYPKLKGIKQYPEPMLSVWRPMANTFMPICNPDEKMLSASSQYVLTCRPLQYRPIFKHVDDFIDVYITDIKTGTKELILTKQLNNASHILLSPNGNNVSYFKNKNWWVYDIKQRIHTNITKSLPFPLYDVKNTRVRYNKPFGNAGWAKKSKGILIYDEFDVWLVSLDGLASKKLTKGRKKKTRYRLHDETFYPRAQYQGRQLDLSDELIFSSYGKISKKSGYAAWTLKKGLRNIVHTDNRIDRLLKAQNNNIYVVTEQRFDMPPKLVLYSGNKTKDIIQSNRHHYEFNWGTSKLIDYTVKGDSLQGALFYPANYQSDKKYPMVVGVYETKSTELHDYVNPSFEIGFGFNCTNFTLNDYFVFYPDISITHNNPGISATNCVVSAVNKVLDMGVVDKTKIGLWGHSFGGYETTFILTQTDLFAAGVAGAAYSMDLLSSYLGIYHNKESEAEFFENFQMRFTGSFWEFKDEYLKNSPVHNLDKVNTPLLSWHGERDKRVDFKQGVELHNAMRRLEKEHVFLVYPNGGHLLHNKVDQVDITSKIMHWFDYKLKGKKPMPWLLNDN